MLHHRLSLGLACFAIAFGACRDDRPLPGADGGAGPDTRGVDAKLVMDAAPDHPRTVDAGLEVVADLASPPPDGPPPDGPPADVVIDLAPDITADTGVPDLTRDTGSVDAAGPTCGPGAARDMLCLSYCDGMGRFCGGAIAQFASADACRAACNAPTSTWACGKPGDLTGNSLFCRLSHMALAGVGDAATECPSAGPNSPVCQ
jgi:hypothetical protein